MPQAAPDMGAESIAGMPEGLLVTLTYEGYENGYILVDHGGALGWAYADLLAAPEEVSWSGLTLIATPSACRHAYAASLHAYQVGPHRHHRHVRDEEGRATWRSGRTASATCSPRR
jgi:hypothetical protein